MATVENLRERIHRANVQVHQVEARFYELIHGEIFSKHEQKRIDSTLRKIDRLIVDNQKMALDFGAGTGNLTGKLLNMGYSVTAVDISAEMCMILENRYRNYIENKRLKIFNSPIEYIDFNKNEFDLIVCYSVLHHLPDYVDTIQQLSAYLKIGGVMYLDHESPLEWDKSNITGRIVKRTYFLSNWLLNKLFFQIKEVTLPDLDYLDYGLSDYWAFKEHHIDHKKLEKVFKKANYTFFLQINYHLNRTWVFNPIFYLYKYFCKPDMGLWIARK